MKNRIIDYIIILVLAIIVSIPLMNSDFDIYRDDGIQHIARLMGTYQTLTEGEYPPVIMSNFCNGFGYSWSIFYSPLTAFLPLIFRLFTSSFELILKLFIILCAFLAGIAMYEFVKKVTKNRYAGLIASAIYIFAPYRLTDMYMRIAVSELASFIFLPIVFHGLYNIFNDEQKSIRKSLLLALGATGLIISHIVIAMYTAIICFVYLLINIKKLKDKQILKMLGINIVLILLLSSFYLLPMLEHRLNTNYEVFKDGRMERTQELIRNKVDPIDLVYTQDKELILEIGLISIIGIGLTIFALKKIDNSYKKLYWFSLITGILCVIFSLDFFPFERLPAILKMIQFTFRLLEFSSFFFAFVAAINYSVVIKNFNIRDVFVLSLLAILLVVPLKKNLDYETTWSEEKLWPAVEVNTHTGRVHAGCATFEYLPSKAFEHLDYIKTRENTAKIISGNAVISNEEKNGTNMTLEISNTTDNTIVELPYIYYLGYDVKIQTNNGSVVKIENFESDNGFVAINVREEGKIIVKYTGTVLMQISYIISAITFVGIIVFVAINRKLQFKE